MLVAALGWILLLTQAGDAPAPEKPTLLVMPLKADKKLAGQAQALDELILEAVDGLKRYSVLGPSDVNALIGAEKMKDTLGCDDVSCAAEIGGALGAPFLLAGELRALGEQVVLSLRLMDTKKRVVLARATARGATTADALNQMMASAVGGCFGATIQAKGAQATSPTPTPTPADNEYSGYTGLITEVSGYVSRSEYSALLAHFDELSARAQKVRSPANGVSAVEMLTYYQALACYMLKRTECFSDAAARYTKQWPTGSFRNGLDTFATNLDDEKTAQRDREAEVKDRVAEIEEKARAGTYDALQAEEFIGLAYYGGRDYAKAAEHFATLLNRLYAEKQPQVQRIMRVTSQAVFSWRQAGDFDACRAALHRAETLDAKAYRTESLNVIERSLPK